MATAYKTPINLLITDVDLPVNGSARITFNVRDKDNNVIGTGIVEELPATVSDAQARNVLQQKLNTWNKQMKTCGRGDASGTAPASSLRALINVSLTADDTL